jgi:hypothetical protein
MITNASLSGLALALMQLAQPAPAHDLKTILAIPITVEIDGARLKDVLDYFRDRYNLPTDIERSVLGRGVGDRLVMLPKVDKVPLGQVLGTILRQVRATYRIEKTKILIMPVLLSGQGTEAPLLAGRDPDFHNGGAGTELRTAKLRRGTRS